MLSRRFSVIKLIELHEAHECVCQLRTAEPEKFEAILLSITHDEVVDRMRPGDRLDGD
jgi:hypothetical protein